MDNNKIKKLLDTYEYYKERIVIASDIYVENGDTSYINMYRLELIQNFMNVEYTLFNIDDLISIGFKYFDDDLLLMPLWVLRTLKIGTVIYTTSDDIIIIDNNTELDTDVKYGVTSYGFKSVQFRNRKIDKILSS